MMCSTGDTTSAVGRYKPKQCLLPGEKIVSGPYSSPPDCLMGFKRSTVFVTNLRVVVNTNLTYLFFLKFDVHESVFFRCVSIPVCTCLMSNFKLPHVQFNHRPVLFAAPISISRENSLFYGEYSVCVASANWTCSISGPVIRCHSHVKTTCVFFVNNFIKTCIVQVRVLRFPGERKRLETVY